MCLWLWASVEAVNGRLRPFSGLGVCEGLQVVEMMTSGDGEDFELRRGGLEEKE